MCCWITAALEFCLRLRDEIRWWWWWYWCLIEITSKVKAMKDGWSENELMNYHLFIKIDRCRGRPMHVDVLFLAETSTACSVFISTRRLIQCYWNRFVVMRHFSMSLHYALQPICLFVCHVLVFNSRTKSCEAQNCHDGYPCHITHTPVLRLKVRGQIT